MYRHIEKDVHKQDDLETLLEELKTSIDISKVYKFKYTDLSIDLIQHIVNSLEYLQEENKLLREYKNRKQDVIEVKGYKAFRGVMKITQKNEKFSPYEVYGDWLYKPEYDCWYGNCSSYPASICEVVEE